AIPRSMIYHVVPLDDWLALPDRPYSPASLADDGFVHCSPDEATTLAVASVFTRTLLVRSWRCSSTSTSLMSWSAGKPLTRGHRLASPPALCIDSLGLLDRIALPHQSRTSSECFRIPHRITS